MLEMVEGSFLDLSPQVWAVFIVVALIMIELFQLGPHTFTLKPKENDGAQKSPGRSKKTKKDYANKVRRRKKGSRVQKLYFNINIYGAIDGPCASIVIAGDKELTLRIQSGSIVAHSGESCSGNSEELDNYVVAYGDEAEETVLDQLEHLWTTRERSKVKCILLYSWRMPSQFALQKMVSLLEDLPGAEKVHVGILYDKEGEEDVISNRGEKEDYLRNHGITLERRDTI